MESRTGFAFLSHRGVDKPRIRGFVTQAIEREVALWIDRPNDFNTDGANPPITPDRLYGHIRPGTDYPTAIDDALFAASVTVVFWSVAWQDWIGVLLREYSVAHARARNLQAAYLPAFLDRPESLPAAVRDFRTENNDNIQGYDVSTSDAPDWARLLDDVAALTRPGRFATTPLVTPAPGTINWLAVLRESNRDADATAALVAAIPPGPAVDAMEMPYRLRVLVANGLGSVESAGAVAEASSFVLETFPSDMHSRRFALVIMPAVLPDPLIGLLPYWNTAFDAACRLGPRMLAALILVLPPAVIHGKETDFARILGRLESWSSRP